MSDLPPGAIRLRGVSRDYKLMLERNQTLKETILRRARTKSRIVPALAGIDLDVSPGTAIGIVGSNGAGKSTLLKVLAGIIPPDAGTVETGGRVVSLLELGAGFHPDFSGRENVVLNASIHGMVRSEIERRMESIVSFAELEAFIDAPVRTYSSGMYARLGFAVAAELEPDILLLDEILAVGDEAFQNKCLSRIARFQRNGVTIVFVSHSAFAVEHICDRAIWLSGGRVLGDGTPHAILEQYHDGLVRRSTSGLAQVESGEWRFGHVTAVRCSNGESLTDRYLSGEPFALDVDFELVEPVPAVVGFTIRTVDGAIIAGTDSHVALDSAANETGRYTARFDVPALPLMEGQFAVDVDLTSATGDRLHHVERALEFTVFSRGRGYGPVALHGTWSRLPEVAHHLEETALP